MGTRGAVALACLAAAGAARAGNDVGFGLEATIGGQHLGVRTWPGPAQLSPMGDVGGAALVSLGVFALGAAGQGTFAHGKLERIDVSALAGLALPLFTRLLRLELLGEAGAARVHAPGAGDLALAPGWKPFYGARPGFSARIPFLPFRVGVWGLARWGMPGAGRGPSYGLLGRVGLDF